MLPFLPSLDFSDFTLCSPALLTVFSATLRPAAAALDAAALVLEDAFFAVDLALEAAAFVFEAAFFAVVFALEVAFFADFFTTAASSFFEIAALTPAFAIPFSPALFNPAGLLIPASKSFCAVALPTPGNAINAASGSFFGLAAISSPNRGISHPYDEPFSFRGRIKSKF